MPAVWGGGAFRTSPLPAICPDIRTTGAILDPKTEFDSPGYELAEYMAKFCLEVTGDVTGQVKVSFVFTL